MHWNMLSRRVRNADRKTGYSGILVGNCDAAFAIKRLALDAIYSEDHSRCSLRERNMNLMQNVEISELHSTFAERMATQVDGIGLASSIANLKNACLKVAN